MTSRVEAIRAHLAGSVAPSPEESLKKERQGATFPARELTHFLDGGAKATELKERLMALMEKEPDLHLKSFDSSRLAERETSMRMFARLVPMLNSQEDEDSRRMLSTLIALLDPAISTRLALQFSLFLGAMRGQATRELFEEYERRGMVEMKNVIGCFAMTELGHGSNVAGLETTATFDLAADEFVIHTPSITASKWWIGGAAMTATYAVVFAQLIVEGKSHGVKPFLVQLRDPGTFALMPGVKIGDCGHKMGRNGLDNGWIQFSSVRIPRRNMLMKHTQVARDGSVKQSPLGQINYGPLVHGRVAILASCSESAKKAVTIAIRYGAMRRQFKAPGEPHERLILDYTTHQLRLFPYVSMAYAIHFCSVEIGASTRALMKRLAKLKGTEEKSEIDRVTESLKEMHGTSAGLKAFCTWDTLKCIEECRQSLGGHGYSSYCGLPDLYQDFAVNCSWEGDNTILTLQTGRYLISCWKEVARGKAMQSQGVRYMNDYAGGQAPPALEFPEGGVPTLPSLLRVLAHSTAFLVAKASDRFQEAERVGGGDHAQQEAALDILACVRLHCQFYLVDRFMNAIQKAPEPLRPVLGKLCLLYALHHVTEGQGAHFQSGVLTRQQAVRLEDALVRTCSALRPDMVPLVDAFNISDFLLSSPLASYRGDGYARYFETAASSDHGIIDKPPFFETVLGPFLRGEGR